VVTELAPGSALAQRAGRANRRGLRPAAPVRVIVPAGQLTDRSRSGPYGQQELGEALDWLRRRADDPLGLAPWRVREDPPPPAVPRRMLYHRPEMGDVWHWARTCDELAAEPELDLWLAESFDQESTVALAVRDAMPVEADDAVSLVRAIPPRDDELFTVPLATARSVLAQALRIGDDGTDRPLAVRRRGDDITVADPDDVRPGDLIVVDSRTAAFTPSTATAAGPAASFSPPTPDPTGPDDADAGARSVADDLLHMVRDPGPGQVVLRLEPGAWPGVDSVRGLLKEYADLPADATDRARRAELRRLLSTFVAGLADHPAQPMVHAAVQLLRARVQDSDILLHRDAQGAPVRLLLLDRRRAKADEWMRQTWLPNDHPVLLDDHQQAVARRAAWIAAQVHLPSPLVDALQLAGAHHDDGKADPRFQAGLGRADAPLAKSGGRSREEFRESVRRAGLPRGWRHEQRSVVACWQRLHATLPQAYAQLAARLVGTSHGHGRYGFPHTAAELLTPGDPDTDLHLATDLFDLGTWDNLIEATHHRWGVWGCAYLEALLRAADGQVSGENS
jgi:CRISPR-associated endonuclease/helicase Cas3